MKEALLIVKLTKNQLLLFYIVLVNKRLLVYYQLKRNIVDYKNNKELFIKSKEIFN